mmetsp:Transcript_56577/g.156568  ORF Transcript_56577/g.156568 Transcript_56577/m.156568 type:complete len:127 (-) Transcript_56577:629-1009(-)
MASKRQLEGKVEEINKSLDDKEEATQYITQAMTRQYEAMQEQLVDKVPPPPPPSPPLPSSCAFSAGCISQGGLGVGLDQTKLLCDFVGQATVGTPPSRWNPTLPVSSLLLHHSDHSTRDDGSGSAG